MKHAADKLMVQVARSMSGVRGSGRLMDLLLPGRHNTRRFIRGEFQRSDGLTMQLDSRNWIDRNVLFRGDMEPHLTRLWEREISPGDTVIDVGANIGVHSLTFSRLVGTQGRVYSFEPNPIVRELLERNLKLNGMNNVFVQACGLGDQATTLPLRVPHPDSEEFSNMGLASFVALDTAHDEVEVPVKVLDDELDEETRDRVKFVKIDVQGFEWAVLKGMSGVLAKARPSVVFEYEEWAWQQCNVTLADVVEWLKERSYVVRDIDEYGSIGQVIDPAGPRHFHDDLIAVPQ